MRSQRFAACRTGWQPIADAAACCYVDDSKGTTVAATQVALEGIGRPVVLIAGGDGKGQSFAPLEGQRRSRLPRGAADRPRRAADRARPGRNDARVSRSVGTLEAAVARAIGARRSPATSCCCRRRARASISSATTSSAASASPRSCSAAHAEDVACVSGSSTPRRVRKPPLRPLPREPRVDADVRRFARLVRRCCCSRSGWSWSTRRRSRWPKRRRTPATAPWYFLARHAMFLGDRPRRGVRRVPGAREGLAARRAVAVRRLARCCSCWCSSPASARRSTARGAGSRSSSSTSSRPSS